jgi:DNA-binding transcriptional ArsR family regulator
MRVHTVSTTPHPVDTEHVSELFKALSDPTRVRIIHSLSQGQHTVNGLVEALALPQSTVSRHLATLRHAHVVIADRQGTSMHYRLADVHVGDLVKEAFSHAEHERLGLPDHAEKNVLTGSSR